MDASHADDLLDRNLVTGIMIYIGDMLIKYISKRQKFIATSTFLSAFMTVKSAIEEAQTITLLLQYIDVPLKGPINIHSDSDSVLHVLEIQAMTSRENMLLLLLI